LPRRQKTEARRAAEFAAILAGAGIVAAGLALLRHHPGRAAVFAAAGLLPGLLAIVARGTWLAVFRLWMRLAEALGWVMTRVILSVFYLVLLTPVGWFRRLRGRPTLDTAWRDGRTTYWVERDAPEPTIERYSKRY
jgi:hypothetical protein